MYDMLTSTMWQDYKGYKRQLELKSDIPTLIKGLLFTIFGIGLTFWATISDKAELCIFTAPCALYGIFALCISLNRLSRLSRVDKYTYDIELSMTPAKIIRTKKGKYGIVSDCEDYLGVSLRLILPPQFCMIERVDEECFIISKKKTFSNKVYYGIYNSNSKKITVPVQFDSIRRPNSSADLYIVEINGRTEKFNSFGDRIIR